MALLKTGRPNRQKLKLNGKYNLSVMQTGLFALIFAVIGGFVLIKSFAANPLLAGDVDNNGIVDLLDLSTVLGNWGATGSNPADIDGNGVVDLLDLSTVLGNWNRTGPTTPAPKVTLSANPTTINSGTSSTLTWSTTNANSCTASGAWTGSKATSGNASTGNLTQTSTFTLTCSGYGGTDSKSVEVVVGGFVSRQGTKLYLNGQPFRFSGINIYNANSDGTNERGCWYNMTSGTTLDDSLSAIANGMNGGNKVIRAWFFQNMASSNGARDWTYFDHTISVAKAHGFKIIATIGDQWGGCDHEGYKDATWYSTGYKTPSPAEITSYREWAGEIAAHYKNDPTILIWQMINEGQVTTADGNCAANAAALFKNWADDVSGVIKAADPNHLVSIGTIGNGDCGSANGDYQSLHSGPNIDLCEYHDYGGGNNPIPGDQWNGMQVRINQCNAINKPLFVGEEGIGRNELGTLQDRANGFNNKFKAQFGAGIVGIVPWDWWNGSGSVSDGYEIGPGDPSLKVFGSY